MNRKLKGKRKNFSDYFIRIWNGSVFIDNRYTLDCILETTKDNELVCFGLQTNLHDDNKDEKVLELCEEIATKIKELNEYLEENGI